MLVISVMFAGDFIGASMQCPEYVYHGLIYLKEPLVSAKYVFVYCVVAMPFK